MLNMYLYFQRVFLMNSEKFIVVFCFHTYYMHYFLCVYDLYIYICIVYTIGKKQGKSVD